MQESIATSSFSVSGTKHSIVLASAKWSCQDCAGKHSRLAPSETPGRNELNDPNDPLGAFDTMFDRPSQQNSSFRLRQSVRALATHWVASARSSALCYLDTIMKSICCTRSNPNIQKGLTAVSSSLWDWVKKILVCWIDWICRSNARGKPVPQFEEWKRIEKNTDEVESKKNKN